MPYHLILDGVMVVACFFIAAQLNKNILTLHSPVPHKIISGGLAGTLAIILWMFSPEPGKIELSFFYLPIMIIGIVGGTVPLISALTIVYIGFVMEFGWQMISEPAVYYLIGIGFFIPILNSSLDKIWIRWKYSITLLILFMYAFDYYHIAKQEPTHFWTFAVLIAVTGTFTLYLILHVQRSKSAFSELELMNKQLSEQHDELLQKQFELSITKQKFQNVVESVREVIFQTNREGQIVFLNAAWEELTSYTVQESMNRYYLEYVYPEDQMEYKENVLRLINEKQSGIRREVRFSSKNHDILWMELNVRFTYDQQGNLLSTFGTMNDITERYKSDLVLRKTLKELEDIKFALDESVVVMVTDSNGVILKVNDLFCSISGYTKEELLGQTQQFLNSGYHPPHFYQHMWETILSKEIWRGQVRNKSKNDSYYWVDSVIVPLLNEEGEIHQFVTIQNDITKSKVAEQKLVEANDLLLKLSSVDGLTGINNRRSFDERLSFEWEKAGNAEIPSPLSAILLDVDHFKLYNDHYGHQQGDECLKQVAKLLIRELPRTTDFGARYGGEEFVILLPNTDLVEATNIAEEIRKGILSLEIEHKKSKVSPMITASLGVASMIPCKDATAKQLLEYADKALYVAKRHGRNRVESYREEVAESIEVSEKVKELVTVTDPVQEYINLLHSKDTHTWEHSNRVAHYAILLAKELGVSEKDREKIYVTALLHDIGKLDIPQSILRKASRLTEEEYNIIKQHPILGVEKLQRHGEFPFKKEILEGVLYHHERWNGSGYPHQLREREIPFNARLLGIVDSFSAMTEERVYKKGISTEQALLEIQSQMNSLYDPELVQAFLRAMKTSIPEQLIKKISS
jgi:diguanylate cyclase (GGDEF)-like protein/PAS domain S-box-containing protein/putative nucleotidyltransferase with HDIG domain